MNLLFLSFKIAKFLPQIRVFSSQLNNILLISFIFLLISGSNLYTILKLHHQLHELLLKSLDIVILIDVFIVCLALILQSFDLIICFLYFRLSTTNLLNDIDVDIGVFVLGLSLGQHRSLRSVFGSVLHAGSWSEFRLRA